MPAHLALAWIACVSGPVLALASIAPATAQHAPAAVRLVAPANVLPGVRAVVEVHLVDSQGQAAVPPGDLDIDLSSVGGGLFLDAASLSTSVLTRVRVPSRTSHAEVNFVHPGPAGTQATLTALDASGLLVAGSADLDVRAGGPSGSLDTTFGGGDAFYSFAAPHECSRLLPDGRLLVVSREAPFGLTIRRFRPDLTLDTTFGIGGAARPLVPGNIGAADFRLGFAGTMVLCTFDATSTSGDLGVIRLNADATVDVTFGAGTGLPVPTGLALDAPDLAMVDCLAIAPDRSVIVLAGDRVVRLTPAGVLDASFGGGGVALLPFGPDPFGGPQYPPEAQLHGQAIAIQRDGKILVAGTRLGRLLANGDMDLSFGVGGITPGSGPPFAYDQHAASIAVQADGRVLVAGARTVLNGQYQPRRCITRYQSDGSKDVGFGVAGTLDFQLLETPPFHEWRSARLALGGSGKIVLSTESFHPDYVVGNTTYGHFRPGIRRWNADGSNDLTFGSSGRVALAPSENGFYKHPVQLALRGDGSAVVATQHVDLSTGAERLALVPLKMDGSRDGSINADGIATFDRPGFYFGVGSCLAAGKDGRVFVGAWRQDATGYGLSVFRLRSDGALDSTFADDGELHLQGANQPYGQRLLSVDEQGRLLVLHTLYIGSNNVFVRRFLADGSPDVTFATGGVFVRSFSGTPRACAISVDSMGWPTVLVDVAGQAVVFRVGASGQLDMSFGAGGSVYYNPTGPSTYYKPSALTLDHRGRIVVSGQRTTPTGFGDDRWMSRLTATGTLDKSFGSAGQTVTDDLGLFDSWTSLAIRGDNTLLVGGSANYASALAVVALLESGRRNVTFGAGGLSQIPGTMQSTWVSSMSCLPDGSAALGHSGFTVTKVTPNGALDAGFGTLGQFAVPVALPESYGPSVGMAANGCIYAAAGCGGALSIVRILP
jgi:uncharacterized delta-60 repeat protein